jgi:hypothetical protein
MKPSPSNPCQYWAGKTLASIKDAYGRCGNENYGGLDYP